MFCLCMGCSISETENYNPSIASLKPNETLVMKFKACHWGCDKGTVKFRNNSVLNGNNNLELTLQEIEHLDAYFLQGKNREEGHRCSLPIEISFKHKKGLMTLNSKDALIYPCRSDDLITPLLLVIHFNETPNEIPFWRLSKEEQNKRRVIH